MLGKPQSTEQILGIMVTWPLDMVHLRKDRIIQILVPGPNLYDKKEKEKERNLVTCGAWLFSLKNEVKIQQKRPGKLELIR